MKLTCALVALIASAAYGERRNVMMITVDDLRPQLNHAYDMVQMFTPNIDRLSAAGTTFHRAYTQMAVCSPSRNSFMSGRRPDTTKVWNFIDHFREEGVGANWISLPQAFKVQGYLTYGSGKSFHPAHPPNDDYPTSWTVDESNDFYWGNQLPIGDSDPCGGERVEIAPSTHAYASSAACFDVNDTAAMNDNDNRTRPQSEQDVEYDHRLATRTIEHLTHAASTGKNFFISVGFRKPHLSWRVPKRFYDVYENVTIDVAKVQTIGKNISVLAYEMNGEMGQVYKKAGVTTTWQESPHGPPLPTDLQRGLRHGYYAAVSFLDFEVGRILDTLDKLSLTESTVTILHSDHGWKLGEHGDWSKCSNWELDTRVPLIIRAPWIPQSVGARTMAFAELVDLYPTLVELAGLEVPASEKLEGVSLAPVLANPSGDAPHNKTAAFSQYPRCPQYDMVKESSNWECLTIPKQNITRMGFSVRTEEARYTEWRIWRPTCNADWTDAGLAEVELYDHTGDMGRGAATFDDFEFENLAYAPEKQQLRAQLSALLRGQFEHDGASC